MSIVFEEFDMYFSLIERGKEEPEQANAVMRIRQKGILLWWYVVDKPGLFRVERTMFYT